MIFVRIKIRTKFVDRIQSCSHRVFIGDFADSDIRVARNNLLVPTDPSYAEFTVCRIGRGREIGRENTVWQCCRIHSIQYVS